jgi:hypothetical protein
MGNITPPSWARHVTIFADNDAVGMAAAVKALRSIQSRSGIETTQIAKTTACKDAADLLVENI